MPLTSRKKTSSIKPANKAATDSAQSSSSEGPSTGTTGKTNNKSHKRSRSGCFTCRLRRKKCDEQHPSCGACINLCVKCEYKRPIWWGNPEHRRVQKERIKNKIKQTKMNERNGTLTGGLSSPTLSDLSPRLLTLHDHDIFASHLPTPAMTQPIYEPHPGFEIDVKTERHTFVNDVPLRHDSMSSTFSTFAPPQLNAPLPTFPQEEWFPDEYFPQAPALPGIDPALCDQRIQQTYAILQSNIPVSDHDRPLLDHFINNVLRIIFPVLEAHQRGHLRAQAILQALETNKTYLHCCLSVAAIHLKTTEGLVGEQIDHDIMRHRFEAVSQLCLALGEDTKHEEILDATLAMIFFHCSVGPADDYLPDIPWYDHFQAASNLVSRLGLSTTIPPCGNPYMLPPFSMTLTSWIDILGSAMHGRTPEFAHTYRSKHLSGTSLGLRELMGCDDRVMYLISEIACLDALKKEGRVDAMAVCSHVSALGRQLEFTEPADQTLESPYTPTGVLRPDILTKNMTAVFRIAARIYLCSLVPGFDRSQPSNINLVQAVANTLQCANLGHHADLGSFGRMYRVLQEVWRATDDPIDTFCQVEDTPVEASTSSSSQPIKLEAPESPEQIGADWALKDTKRPQIHWREVLQQNGWNYLLI
ncbi:unnamed protein product [Aspergillus oryzae var. brunneus]|uniref:Unnamed protein product n=2 Tax=Aspergillus oryzae TaxID=5062 RepID=A0AAN4YNW9_ASPOZ|nr:unnamed protein product [Aspergillus oryzae]GMG34253.1 unnamed protein product [Aspergillus oryzae]GMG53534.1 unnamed protein product [Aspergillus oryzae var. brunneus]